MSLIQDKRQAENFLKLLDEEAETFTFQTFSDKKPKPNPDPLCRIFHGSLDECWDELVDLNNKGAGIFVTVNETDAMGRKKENITRIRAVFVEDDRGGAPELPTEPHIIVESSPGKQHKYILTDTTDVDEFEPVQQRLVDDYGSDPNAKDRARVLRLPGFYHKKGEPHLVKIISNSGYLPLPWEKVKEIFPPVEKKSQSSKFTKSEIKKGQPLDEIARIYSALQAIDPDIGYLDWIKVGMALHAAEPGEEGFKLWDQWSKLGYKYKKDECAYRWDTFVNNDGSISLATIYEMAYQAGWDGEYLNDDKGIQYAKLEYKRKLTPFAERHGMVMIEGKARIVYRQQDKNTFCWNTQYTDARNLSIYEENNYVPVVKSEKNGDKKIEKVNIVTAWRNSNQCKRYDQVLFNPVPGMIAQDDILPDEESYNLYQGLMIGPKAGDCSLILDHIENIWCNGNEETFEYVINWLARLFQKPNERGHTVIVLKSGEGTGKNIIVDIITEAFGVHGITVTKPEDLTGKFNDHLGSAVVVFANEAIWGGNKNCEGFLKSYITDQTLRIEKKHLPQFEVKNCGHLIMATNNDRFAPIGINDRRFFVLDVSESKKGDFSYFNNLIEEIENGGKAAFIDYLMNIDIANFNPREMPKTQGKSKLENKIKSADSSIQWIHDCLMDGEITCASDDTNPTDNWENQEIFISNKFWKKCYTEWAKSHGRHVENINIKSMETVFGDTVKSGRQSTGSRERGIYLPSLDVCRNKFEEFIEEFIEWNDDTSISDDNNGQVLPFHQKQKKDQASLLFDDCA